MFFKFKDSKQNTQVALLGQTRVFDTKRKIVYISSIDCQTLKAIKENYKKHIVK